MKALVVSDSHRELEYLIEIFEKENPNIVLFAGDHSKDGIELSYVKPEAKYYIVKGNTDIGDYETKELIEIEINGKKVFLTHGHLFGVKRSYEEILMEAMRKNVDIVIFGHTHRQYFGDVNGVKMFNPGAVLNGEYGIINFEDERIEFFHRKLEI